MDFFNILREFIFANQQFWDISRELIFANAKKLISKHQNPWRRGVVASWRRGVVVMCCLDVVVITTAQLHLTKPELRFCAGSSPARAV